MSPACQAGGPLAILDQAMSDFWWKELPWNTFFFEYFGFPLSVSCRHCSVLIFIHMFLLPKEQRGENKRLPKSNDVSKTVQHWIEKYFNLPSS